MGDFEFENLIVDFVCEYSVNRNLCVSWSKRLKGMGFAFAAWLRSTGIRPQTSDMTPDTCRAYILYLKGRYHNWTIRHYFNAIKLFADYLIKRGLLQSNPLKDIKIPPAYKKMPNILNDEEYNYLIDNIKSVRFRHPFSMIRNHTFFRLWKVTGLRVGEMLNLKMSDFRLSDSKKSLQIWNGKRNRYDYLPLAVGVVPDIEKYIKLRGFNHSPNFFLSSNKTNKWGYIGVKRLFKRLKKLGYLKPEITPHNFRATFCCNLLKRGVNVFEVQELMRHTNLQSTLFYVRNDPARLQEYVDKLL